MTTRRQLIAGLASSAAFATVGVRAARAADPIRLLTNWYAEAEHGGFYAAQAAGIYAKHGIDCTIVMGGPQINGMQLLMGGDADVAMGYDTAIMTWVERGLPVIAVGACFQFDMQGIMAHTDITSLADLKGHRILVAGASTQTFWPWLRERYGYTDDQIAPYTFNLQPFFTDATIAQQAYATSEPYQAQVAKVPINFFLFAKFGYPVYGETLVTPQPFLAKNPDLMRRFIAASMEGWRTYLRDPAPANALIKRDNPKMTDAQLAYSVARFRAMGVATGGDAAKHGIGTMTDARWKATRDFMVRNKLLRAETDWKSAYTLDYVKDLRVLA
jgi:NitT/TauT family transport system substrate-binding protein